MTHQTKGRQTVPAKATANVPCNGCVACCRGPITLHASLGDDPTMYVTEEHPEWGVKLLQTVDGWCFYLRDGACAIYEDRPALCRAFDCRVYAKGWGRLDPLRDDDVIAAGLERQGA